ncbi:MAG: PD-(D/E)XK nuclease family protein [Bacilli bacterium]|nr:PD-(D/E)XK nuclease family protein [Bacilli bacterium]
MNYLDNIENNTLIICNNSIKEKILLESSKLLNIKIMSLKEFYNNYFFSYDEKTIYYVKNKYNVTREIACIYLDNLKYVIDNELKDSKINFLKELYNDLKNNNLLTFNKLFKSYLEKNKILVFETNLDKFTLNILNKYNVKYIDIYSKKRQTNVVYHFNSIEEEVEYTFNKISEYLKNGIDISKIKLVILGMEYNILIKRFSYLYNIPINNKELTSIYGTVTSKKFITLIKNNLTKKEILNNLKECDDYFYKCYLDIINKYYFVDNLTSVIDFIEYDLKNTYIKEEQNKNAIDIIPLDSNLIMDEYVFVLGFSNENIPITHKDIDYFNDDLKTKLGINTSIENNKVERKKCINHIDNILKINISYKDKTPYNTFLKSNLIDDLNLEIKDIYLDNITSNLYNKIKLTNNLDNLIKYGVKNTDLSKLYNTYNDIEYLTYSNTFKGLKDFQLDNIRLSYSSINNYYHCSFRYYIENILKLNIYEESFKQFIGNLFHFVLSHVYDKDFDFEYYFNSYIKDKELSKKELFYLKDLKLELCDVIKVIKYQYSLTGLTNVLLEQTITINYDDKCSLVGIIDKIMFKEKDNDTYISIIDYKTGNPSINISNLKYGLDMQLPIYVYLTLNSNLFKNPKIIGFYLEQIIHEKSGYTKDLEKSTIDNLKLQGYTINDEYLVSMFDSSYENSEMIKSMKTTKSGFSYYSKVLSESEILEIANLVEEKIKNAFNEILQGNFSINPKVINGENIGCKFCKYQDLCFKTGKDLVYLKDNSQSYDS